MYTTIKKELLQLANKELSEFNTKLCPDTNKQILGIRIPVLRKIAQRIAKGDWQTFLKESNQQDQKEYIEQENINKEETELNKKQFNSQNQEKTTIDKKQSNRYLEEILLEGFVISYAKIELEEKLKLIEKFIPKMDSWIITDTFCPTIKIKKQDLQSVWDFILPYTKSNEEFEVRFAVIMMLDNFIIEEYVDKVIRILDGIKNDAYYAQMAIAWTIAEIGIKFNDKTMTYLKGKNNLDKFTYNKALRKMIESYRILDSQKDELRKMKRK